MSRVLFSIPLISISFILTFSLGALATPQAVPDDQGPPRPTSPPAGAVRKIVNRDDLTPLDIDYTLRVQDDGESLAVSFDAGPLRRDQTRIAMPNWAPGSYRIVRYGDSVENLKAVDIATGRELEILALDHQTWSIATRGVSRIRCSYQLKKPRRRRFSGRTVRDRGKKSTGIHFQGPGTFMYVVGQEQTPVTVKYELPANWRVANGLLPTGDPMVKTARSYDTLIDAPTTIGLFVEKNFEVDGTPFQCIFFTNSQKYDFNIDAFVDVVRTIVVEQGKIFGSFPFPFYVFHFILPGGGGLEHLNSTSIGLGARAMKRDVNAGASITAHEFFHTWNVKRIRPAPLGPFEYQHENYTGNLWVAEGWTSYYGDLSMARSGIISRDRFLQMIQTYIGRETSKPSRKKHSVAWTSRAVWHRLPDEAPRVSYYTKGEILGMLIDLKIRHVTDNKKSLDDVMRFLNRWFAEYDRGFEERDIERACTAISNHDFGEFFARHVNGTLDPPYAEILAYAGLTFDVRSSRHDFPFPWRMRNGKAIVRGRGTAITDLGLKRNDVIESIDGDKNYNARALLDAKRPGDEIKLVLSRDDETEHEVMIKVLARDVFIPKLGWMEKPSRKQMAIREGWLTGR